MNRRKTDMPDETTEKLMQVIAECKDDNLRAVLVIIHAGFSNLSSRMDAVLDNETALRKIVLNGHSEVHDEDHALLASCKTLNVVDALMWVRDQRIAEAANSGSKRRIGEGIITAAAISGASMIATLLLLGAGVWLWG